MYRTIVVAISILIVLLLGGTFISMVRERARSEVRLSSTPAMFVETAVTETPEPPVQADANDMQTGEEILPKRQNNLFLPIIRAASESTPEQAPEEKDRAEPDG